MIVGLLSWYEERPAWLSATVASLAPFCDHLVAVDGAYALFPGGRARSCMEQAEAIRETAAAVGLGCTVHEPRSRWMGNETEKRALMFRLGEAVTAPEDWYFVVDGDEVVTDPGVGLRDALASSSLDVGEVTLWRRRPQESPEDRPFASPLVESHSHRMFFRAVRGLTVGRKHYQYVTPDGRFLWGDGPCAPALDLSTVRVEHRNGERDRARAADSRGYYERRDALNIEGLVA